MAKSPRFRQEFKKLKTEKQREKYLSKLPGPL